MGNNSRKMYALSAIVLLMILAACSPLDMVGGSPAATSQAKDAERATITIMANLHTSEVPSRTIELLLEEQTGFKLDIHWTPDGSYEEKFNAAMATDTLQEAVFLKNGEMLNLVRDPIRSGMFWEIGPLLEDYPNLSRLNAEILHNSSVDGRVYGIYQERPLSRQGLIYRKDWADRLGLAPPRTIDELYEMLRAFTQDDPDGNGRMDTFGLADRSDLVFGAFKTIASYFGVPNGWGEQEGQLMPDFMFPEYMHTMNFFRRLHEEGLMNRDFPVTAKTDQQELFITGQAGVYVGAMGDVNSLQLRAREAESGAVFDVHNRIAGPLGERVWATTGYGTLVLFPKSSVANEDELADILTFFDRLMEPETANLLRWGIEGEHHTIRSGRAVPSDDIAKMQKDVTPYHALEIGGPSTIEDYLQFDFNLEAKDKAELLTRDNESMLVYNPALMLDSPTNNERGARLFESIQDATYQYILGMIDEQGFRQAVERWLELGGQAIIDEYNADRL
jgi:putative aldouronate transport system substrate-binding protein